MQQDNKIWEVIEKNLTEEQVITILADLGSAPPRRDNENNLVFQSVCHNSDSWKLCYYVETHSFFCYRDWESFNIFNLVMQVKECDFKAALNYICNLLGIRIDTYSAPTQGFVSNYTKADWDIFDKFDRLQSSIKPKENNMEYNPNILNLYSEAYFEGWIKENISVDSMKKYHIKYDIVNNRIIIPHFDINNNLIGIRCRNLNPYAEAKYCPIYIENKLYNHSLSTNLYGLHRNKHTIERMKKVMIVESEKSTLQAETYFPDNNFVVACCGSSISNEQIQLLLTLGVEEVILGMDWDFEKYDETDEKYRLYKKKIMKLCQKLVPYFTVKVLMPPDEHFIYKCSPSDLGKDYLLKSMKNKITVTYDTICAEKELEELKKGE